MVRFHGRVLAAALLLTLGFAGAASAQTAGPLEGLLKETKLDFKVVKPGIFRLVLESPEGVSTVVLEEVKMAWKDGKGNEQYYAQIFTIVANAPADFKASNAMLTRLSELNDTIRFGSVSMYKDKDAVRFFRQGSLFLRNTGSDQLYDLLVLTHFDRLRLAKDLKGFIEEK